MSSVNGELGDEAWSPWTSGRDASAVSKGKARQIDDDDVFVYNGKSLASSRSYDEGLKRVLQGSNGRASPAYDEQLQRILGAEQMSPVRMNGTGNGHAHPEELKDVASDFDELSPLPTRQLPLSQSITSSIGLGQAPRRPAMHPQISRLRSTQMPSHQHRISSASSYTTAHSRPGARAFSPSSSQFDALSRRSSASNLPDGQSPALSELPSSSATSQAGAVTERSPIKWTPLKRLTSRMASAKLPPVPANQPRSSATGRPTCIAASGLICIGTANGWTVVFDYSQTIRCICGLEGNNAVTALAISQDHTFIAVGHASGSIYLYDLKSPAQPSRAVPAVSLEQIIAGRAEGHIAGTAIKAISFVGARHTAIISSDERGMSFSHSLGKVLGLANTDVARILGRYPDEGRSKAGKTSPIWDLAALPLGTTAHAADSHALVAMITPVKLVLVGLKPKPRTWWRGKPAEGKERKPQCGGLAWQPNVKGQAEDPLLAFVWDEDIRVMAIVSGVDGTGIEVREKATWKADGPVVGLHWLSARTLLLVLATHLEILDVPTRQRTGRAAFDLAALAGVEDARPVSPLLGAPSLSMLNVRNLRVYKSKVFALLQADVRVGTVLSWADRILTLVSSDNLLEAISLTTSFYLGEAHASSLGLPEDDEEARHSIVSPKLNELLVACVEYAFSEERFRDGTHDGGVDRTNLFEGLVDVAIRACLALGDLNFLWEEVFERFLEYGIERIFLIRLEPFVLTERMRSAPTQVLQKLIAMHEEREEADIVEQIIWHVDPECLDLNQALSLCQRWQLYDALAYVQSRALHDFVAPLVDFLRVIRQIMQERKQRPQLAEDDGVFVEDRIVDAYKAYVYLSDTLLGLSYPSKEPLPRKEADAARASLYDFLFSGRSLVWPAVGGRMVLTVDEEGAGEPTYPYLRLLLRFDAEAALDALDAAFEDSYLNENAVVDRQLMINVLLEVMNPATSDFAQADRTFLNIFVARNLAKYQQMQYVLLPSSTSHRILVGLADDPDLSTAEDRQLAAEYLLSVYQPHDLTEMLERFERARFYRILRSIYRGERRWAALASVYLQDPEISEDIFQHLRDVLSRAMSSDDAEEASQTRDIVLEATPQLAQSDARATAALVNRYFAEMHDTVIGRLADARSRQYAYLRFLLAPGIEDERPLHMPELAEKTRHLYVELLCEYDPASIVDLLAHQARVDRRAIEICEEHEVFDAVVWALHRNGQTDAALAKYEEVVETRADLLRHSMLQGEEPDPHTIAQAARVAQMACTIASRRPSAELAERAWVRVLSSLVLLSRVAPGPLTAPLLTDALAALVASDGGPTRPRISLSRLARRLLEETSSLGGNYGSLRPLVEGLLAAHRSEAATLAAARELADRDRFDALAAYSAGRAQGWAPIVQPADAVCEACGEPAWDRSLFRPAYGAQTLSSSGMELQQSTNDHENNVSRLALESPDRTRSSGPMVKRPSLKGKERIQADDARRHAAALASAERNAAWQLASGVVLRRDGKVWHRGCFEAVNDETNGRDGASLGPSHDELSDQSDDAQ